MPTAIININHEFAIINLFIVNPTIVKTITLMAEEKTSGKNVFHLSPKYLAVNGTVYTILQTKLTTELTPAIANTPKLVVFINIKTINVLTAPDNNTNMELSFNLFTTVKTLNKH